MTAAEGLNLVFNIASVGLLAGIFMRIGAHGARLDGLEKNVEDLWNRINARGEKC